MISVIQKKEVRIFFGLLVLIVFVTGVYAFLRGRTREDIVFREALDERVALLDGEAILLRDVAVYVAYEEEAVEELARIYDSEDTGAFWRGYTNHMFFRSRAKQTTLDMAVHDVLFYRLAHEMGMELDETEERYVSDARNDFWNDLEEEQKEALGISRAEADASIEKIAIAEKYQTYLAGTNEEEYTYEDYGFSGEAYRKILKEHKLVLTDNVWNRIDFGRITVNH